MNEEAFTTGFYLLIASGVVLASAWIWRLRHWNEVKQLRWLSIALVIAAFIYVIFAIISLNVLWITIEVLGLLLFGMFVWLGYHYSPWFVAMGWLLHVIWDYGLHPNQSAPYVPNWYPELCIGFDTVVAIYLAYWSIVHGRDLHTPEQ